MRKVFLLFILLFCSSAHAPGQNCEVFDRALFHMLPKEVPDKINCTDSLGRRQGWWILYDLSYRNIDSNSQGVYVDHYKIGKYGDDKRIGVWKTFSIGWEQQVDSYYYSKDTIRVYSAIGWYEKVEYEAVGLDSSTISGRRTKYDRLTNTTDTISLYCNKKANTCNLFHKKELIRTFPFSRHDIVFDMAFTLVEAERERRKFLRSK